MNRGLKILQIILLTLLVVFVVTFAVFNSDKVAINLIPFGMKVEMRLFFLVIICICLGVLLNMFFNFFGSVRRMFGSRVDRNKINKLEKEIDQIKAQQEEQDDDI